MAVDVPGSSPGSNLTMQEWEETIQSAVYDRSKFLKKTVRYKRGYNQLNIRKLTATTGATIASTDDGTTMTFNSMNPTVVTMTPAWFFVGHAYPDSLPWTSGDGVSKAAAQDVEAALTAYLESQYLADFASLTAFIGNNAYDMDVAGFRAAVAQLYNTGKTETEPGEAELYSLAGALQHDDVMSIPEFTHADQRGDGQNPLVSGIVGKGNAVTQMFTTLLTSDANGLHGGVWTKSAFGYFFNKEISVEKQRYLKQTRVMADCHFGHNIVHNARAIGIRTRTT